jgi:energy-coupling factor transporter ATP-binding protein EcfA2
MRAPHDWYQGKPPLRWSAEDIPTGAAVELAELSTAQKRWSSLAIQLAISAQEDDPEAVGATHRLLVLDEPEAALHASAQRFLAQEIGNSAHGLQVIVASHSPAFLDHTGFRLHHVHRDRGGRTALTQLLVNDLDSVRNLGLAPSDLFQHLRVFVVVEGRHDEIIMRSAIGQQLHDVGAEILPMGGAKLASPMVDSRLIFDYSDAKVLVVIDNTDAQVLAIWERAVVAAGSGSPSTARTILLEELRGEGESVFIRNFAIRAVERGQTDRIDLYGLSKADILEYLTPGDVMPKASGKTWDRLRSESGTRSGKAIKKTWLSENYDFSGDDTTLENAVSQLDELPPDFTGLIDEVTRMARNPWWH